MKTNATCGFALWRREARTAQPRRPPALRSAVAYTTGTHSRPNVSATARFVTLPGLDVHARGQRRVLLARPVRRPCSPVAARTAASRWSGRRCSCGRPRRACSSRSSGRRRRRCTSGCACVVGRLVSTQPPWSMATSMITARGCIGLQVLAADQVRRLGAGDQHRADDQVGPRAGSRGCCAGR